MNENITPLPWRVHRRPTSMGGAVLNIVNDEFCEYVSIATIYAIPQKREQYEAIAEYVLTACNAYPALTARVKELEEALKLILDDTGHWRAATALNKEPTT